MPGIRLHHETERNCVIAVEAVRPYAKWAQARELCPLCGIPHAFKTVHLTLDNNGDVIVSKEVWAELKDLPGLPFTPENQVKKPPKLIIGMNGGPSERPKILAHQFEGRR